MIQWQDMERFAFGDSSAMADELAALVLAGLKRATCWAAADGMPTHPGKRMVMVDGAGHPRAVIETLDVVQQRFIDVDAAFAFEEGEGDRSLEFWRRAHQDYFTRQGQFSEDMLLYCERFRLVEQMGVGA